MTDAPKAVAPEIIAVASGKGGTGKTLLAACLGYALLRAGHRVLFVDADPGTDGLSLLILGPKGIQAVDSFGPNNTFRGVLNEFKSTGQMQPEPRRIERTSMGDHGVAYTALISGQGLYGEVPIDADSQVVPDLSRNEFREAIVQLFTKLRSSSAYDFIIVDTRGGFAFESTDVCAAADSFILVTDPDYTSFHQDRNLVAHISAAAKSMHTKTLLRAVLVNRAVDGEEKSFRLELEKEFPIRFTDTFAIPLDLEALKAYRIQQMPYVRAAGSAFAAATLSAFSDILRIVTAQWPRERVEAWNALVQEITTAVNAKNSELEADEAARANNAGAVLVARRYRAFLIASVVLCTLLTATLIFAAARSTSPSAPPNGPVSISLLPAQAAASGAEQETQLVEPEPLPPPTTSGPSSAEIQPPPADKSPVNGKKPAPRPVSTTSVGASAPSLNLLPYVTPRGSYQALAGQHAANGKDLYRYTVWLDIDARYVGEVELVRYSFNHPSFGINGFLASQAPKYATSYDGWGCVSSVTATITLHSGPPQVLEFDQCAAIKNTSPPMAE